MKNATLKGLFAFVALVFSGAALYAETTLTFSNTSGENDIDNAENWTGSTLPQGSSYRAYIGTASTASLPYTNKTCTVMKPNSIQVDQNETFDLGKGNVFAALYRFYFNAGAKTITLKSGLMGVDWDSGTERFFIGDSGAGGGTVIVDGPDAILTSSKKSDIEIGTNMKNNRLIVRNGGTVRGNVRSSVTNTHGTGTDNSLWVEGEGSTVEVPSDTEMNYPISIGCAAKNCSCVVTNGGAIKILAGTGSSSKNLVIGTAGNGYKKIATNCWMQVVDHASVDVKDGVWVGREGSSNSLYVAGASTVNSGFFTVSAEPDYHVFYESAGPALTSATRGNAAYFTGEGTKLTTGAIVAGYKYTRDSLLSLSNGASATATTLCVGNLLATNNTMIVADKARVDLTGSSLRVGDNDEACFQTFGNRLVLDDAALNLNYADGAYTLLIGGVSNRIDLLNGSRMKLDGTSGGTISVGTRQNEGATLYVGPGSSLVAANAGKVLVPYIPVTGTNPTHSRLIVDGGTFVATNSAAMTVQVSGAECSLFVTNGIVSFASPADSNFSVGRESGTDSNTVTVATGAVLALTNFNVWVGARDAVGQANGNRLTVDGGTMLVCGGSASQYFCVGRYSASNVLEVTNGGRLNLRQMGSPRVGGENAYGKYNLLRVSNKGHLEIDQRADAKQNFYVGSNGPGNVLEIDNGYLTATGSLIRLGTTAASVSNSFNLVNGATGVIYRVIMAECDAPGQRLLVDDSYLRLTTDGIEMGKGKANSSNHLFHVRGPRAKVVLTSGSLTMSTENELRFTIDRGGFRNGVNAPGAKSVNAVLQVAGQIAKDSKAIRNPRIRIDIADDYDPAEEATTRYTLLYSNKQNINWDDFDLVYDSERIKIVQKDASRLVVRVKRRGIALIVK